MKKLLLIVINFISSSMLNARDSPLVLSGGELSKKQKKRNKNTHKIERQTRRKKKRKEKNKKYKYYKGVDGYIRDDNYALNLTLCCWRLN